MKAARPAGTGGRGAMLAVCIFALLPFSAAAQEQRAFLDTIVNGTDRGDRLVLLRGSDVLMRVDVLRDMGIDGFGGRRETSDGAEVVSLESLAPDVRFVMDERELRLTLTVDPDWLGRSVRNMSAGEPQHLEYRRTSSLFTNYALTTRGHSYDLFTESGLAMRGAVLYHTANTANNRVVRGLTNVTVDQRREMRRWVGGDTFIGGSVLGGDALVGGISVSRDFTLAPYFVRYPTLSVSTPVTTPSTVEVFVNGRRTLQEQVQPGRLDLQNLPLTAGTNDTRVVVRDAFGGTRELQTGYYMTTTALAPGVHDYQYALGRRRQAFGNRSFDYGSAAFSARHRAGITDWLTIGGRIEGERRRLSGGPVVNLRLPKGEAEAALGVSRGESRPGAAAQGSFVFSGSHVSTGASLRLTSEHYATLSMDPLDLRPRSDVSVFTSVPAGKVSLTLQHTQAFGGEAAQRRTSVLGSSRLNRRLDLVSSLAHVTRRAYRSLEASVGVTLSFGEGSVASVSAVRGDNGLQQVVDVQRPLPLGTGYGYQLRAAGGDRGDVDGALQYQGEYGRYEIRRELVGATPQTTVNVSGGIVAIGGGLHATRAVRNSFALVRVPGVAGVRAYSNHQEIGRTNARGEVLIPELLPYYGNPLQIADTDVPLDYEIQNLRVTLAPSYRAGAIVLFPVRRVQQIGGSVVLVGNGRREVPVYGELTVTVGEDQKVSPLGTNGGFYFENIPPGRYPAVVSHHGRTCSFVLEVGVSDDPAIALGVLECAVEEGRK